MTKLTQQEKKTLLALLAAVMSLLQDTTMAELSGLTLRPFMERKGKAKELLRKILEESK